VIRRDGEIPNVHDQAAASPSWDYDDAYGGPWRIGYESREDGRLAIKSGPFTIVTIGDYFDGGGSVEDRVQFICDVLNEKFSKEGLKGV
jgi:hypothetical protein